MWGVASSPSPACRHRLALRARAASPRRPSLCWGIAWVAIARLTGDLLSTPTAVAAIVAVVAIVIVTIVARLRATTEDPDRIPAATVA